MKTIKSLEKRPSTKEVEYVNGYMAKHRNPPNSFFVENFFWEIKTVPFTKYLLEGYRKSLHNEQKQFCLIEIKAENNIWGKAVWVAYIAKN